MKNTINKVLRGLKSIKVRSIVKSKTAVIGGLMLVLLAINYTFGLWSELKKNEKVIYFINEKQEVRKNVEFLDREIRELYIELESEIDYNSCIDNQLQRVINNMATDFDFCDLIEEEDFSEDDAFVEKLLEEL